MVIRGLDSLTAAVTRNGGPGGLPLGSHDLSDQDLSGIAAFRLHQSQHGTLPALWLASRFGRPSLNLVGVDLRRSTLVRTNLRDARMQLADLRGADLYEATLTGADCYRVNAAGASFYRADLRNAKLERATMTGCDLRSARLAGANLLRVNLDGALLHRSALGARLLQEDRTAYARYVADDRRITDFALAVEPVPAVDRSRIYPLFGAQWLLSAEEQQICDRHLRERYLEAAEIYRTLQACFAAQGRGDDASWAYVKARRMDRKTLWPSHARNCYASDWLVGSGPLRTGQRALTGARYIARWSRELVYDAVSGYGERPFRPAGWVALLLAAFAVWFAAFGRIEPGRPPSAEESILLSMASMVAVGFSDLAPEGMATQLASTLESGIGLALFALLMFTLGNRMARR